MYRYIESHKVAAPVLRSVGLLDQLRERIRYLHYSLQTEKSCLILALFFIRWQSRNSSVRHPKDILARLLNGTAARQNSVHHSQPVFLNHCQ